MADYSLDQLLLGFDIDLTPLKTNAAAANAIIDKLEANWLAKSKSMGSQTAESVAKTADSVEKVVESTNRAADASRTQASASKGVSKELDEQTRVHNENILKTKEETEEIKKQTAELRKKRLEQLAEQGERKKPEGGESGGEGGGSNSSVGRFVGGGIKSVTKGLFGEGLASEVAAGVVGGEAIGAALDVAAEGLTKFVELLKDAVLESSKLENVRQHFEGLAQSAGINMPEALEKMRNATHGTVADLDILRLGTAFLQSGFKVSTTTMTQYTEAIVGLARGTGHTATQGIDALYTVMETGNTRALAAIVGINRYSLIMQQAGTRARGAAAGIASVSQVLSTAKQYYESVGQPALTLDDHIQRLNVSFHNMFEELAAGFAGSQGTRSFGDWLDKISETFEGLSDDVKPAGQALGSILNVVTALLTPIGQLANAVLTLAGAFTTVGDNAEQSGKKLSTTGKLASSVTKTAILAEGGIDLVTGQVSPGTPGHYVETVAQNMYGKQGNNDNFRYGKLTPESLIDIGNAADNINNSVDIDSLRAGPTHDPYKAFDDSSKRFLQVIGQDADSQRIGRAALEQMSSRLHELTEQRRGWLQGLGIIAPPISDIKKPDSIAPPPPVHQVYTQGELKKAQLALEAQKLKDQESLQESKDQHARERQENQSAYDAHLKDQAAYLVEKTRLDQADLDDQIKQIKLDTLAKKQAENASFIARSGDHENLNKDFSHQYAELAASPDRGADYKQSLVAIASNQSKADEQFNVDAGNHQKTLANIESEGQVQITERRNKFNAGERTQTLAQQAQDRAAKLTGYAQDLEEYEKHMQERALVAKNAFNEGKLSPDDYTRSQLDEAQKFAGTKITNAQEVFQGGENNPETQAKYLKTTTLAIADFQKTATSIYEQETANQIRYIQNVYGAQQKTIDSQLALNKQFGFRENTGHSTASLQQAAISSLNSELQEYYATFEKLNNDPTTQFHTEWQEVVDKTNTAYQSLLKYKDELASTVSLAGPLGSIFGTLGNSLQELFKTEGAQYYSRITAVAPQSNKGTTQDQTVANRRFQIADIGSTLASSGGVLSQVAGNDSKIHDLFSGGQVLPPEVKKMNDLALQVHTAINAAVDPVVAGTGTLKTALDYITDALRQTAQHFLDIANGKALPSTSGSGSQIPVESTSNLGLLPSVSQEGYVAPERPGALSTRPEYAPETVTATTTLPDELPVSEAQTNDFITPKPVEPLPDPKIGAAADSVGKFAAKLEIAVQGITSFISSMTSAKSAVSGGIAGGISGAGLGSEAQSATAAAAKADPGGVASSISDSLGSAMPLIGAALGMVMGGILGEKNAMVQKELNELKDTYQQMQEAYSSGNATLSQTISSLEALIAEAQQDEANSKKGGSQFADLINQYNQQLQQYMDQQQQLMIQLNQSALTLSLPNQGQNYSSYIGSLQAVITQYEAYMGAAKAGSDQAIQAQTYLQQSLSSYTDQWTQQLNTDAATAVQNALQLNQLITQRNELLQTTAQNERNILSQGVLTRQQTFAQSKAQQLAASQYQTNLQLDQMNQQIDLAQAQVTAAQTVFNLATTRVGLEAQLLQLQEAQTTRQMQGVAALANLVNLMNAGVANNGSAVSTQNNFITSLLASLGGLIGSGGTSGVSISQLLASYNNYASSGILGANGTGI